MALTRAAVLAIAALAIGCTPEPVAVRTVAFDNVYGARVLNVRYRIDDRRERPTVATCDAQTCSFKVSLPIDAQRLGLAVEQGGFISGRTTIDVSAIKWRVNQ